LVLNYSVNFWSWSLNFIENYVPSEEEKDRKSKCDKNTIVSKKEMDFLKDLPANMLKNKIIDFHFSNVNDFEFFHSSEVKSQR
jgi:hypothetical protein